MGIHESSRVRWAVWPNGWPNGCCWSYSMDFHGTDELPEVNQASWSIMKPSAFSFSDSVTGLSKTSSQIWRFRRVICLAWSKTRTLVMMTRDRKVCLVVFSKSTETPVVANRTSLIWFDIYSICSYCGGGHPAMKSIIKSGVDIMFDTRYPILIHTLWTIITPFWEFCSNEASRVNRLGAQWRRLQKPALGGSLSLTCNCLVTL